MKILMLTLLSMILHLEMLEDNVFLNICMLNLKLNVFISIVKNILFVKSNKNYHLQTFFFIMYT